MNIREYVDGLFLKYQDTEDMADFKEEVCVNLQERIDYLVKKGILKDEAFKKATEELGDISEIADQISNNKRKEVIEYMYMKTKNYMSKQHIIGYTVSGGILAIGIVLSLMAYLSSGDIVAGIGSLIPFLIVPVCGFVFLGLTQETARTYPMHWKRALFYVGSVGIILFGFIVASITFFGEYGSIKYYGTHVAVAPIGTLIPFVIPGSIALAYLILTEKDRNKPWVHEEQAIWAERMKDQFADPYVSTRFGLFSGALWIFSVALFLALGFLIGFQYSWLIFIFSIPVQLLILAIMTPKNSN